MHIPIPILGPFECRVWWADIQHPIEDLTSVLSDVELERVSRFRRMEDRHRSVTGSWLLRTAAAAQLGTSPAEVPIERRCLRCDRPHGKTYIKTSGPPLHASISHSGNRVAVALSTAGQVGVDVEEVIPAPGGIAHSALSPAERAALEALPEQDREAGFIRIWVRKEAVLKATGHGLQIPPNQVEVTGPEEEPALLSWPLDPSPGSVDIRTLDPGSGYTGVVAILTEGNSIKVHESAITRTKRTNIAFPARTAA